MSKASVIFLVSHSGPAPPEGGYVYWGVKGKVKGKWKVWQTGYNGKLLDGHKLIDPMRNQK
jgi:hypothetical protein